MILCGIDYPVKPDNDSFYLCFEGAPVKPDNDGNRAGRVNNSRKERADKDREGKNGNKGENDGEDLKRNDGSLSPRRCISRDRIIL